MPSLARSVPKPLKVPSLARSVPIQRASTLSVWSSMRGVARTRFISLDGPGVGGGHFAVLTYVPGPSGGGTHFLL